MGAHFPAVEVDNAIRFSILSSMSGFLWHSFKWACRFGHFLQYTSVLEVLACSLDTDNNYVTAMLHMLPIPEPLSTVAAIFKGEMWQLSGWQLSGCILVVGLDYYSIKVFPLIDSYFILYSLQIVISTNRLNTDKLNKVLKDRNVAPAALSPGPEALCCISNIMRKFPRWDF